jgi:hypothetical protein
MNLDKFIANLVFKYSSMFKNDALNMQEFKYQVGKDYHRIDVSINDNPIPQEILPKNGIDTSHYELIVDNLNKYIMKIMAQNKIVIKINNIIKINALITQSIFNVIVNSFVSILLTKDILAKNGTKNINIVLKPREQYIQFTYKSSLLDLDSLCECGSFFFVFKANLMNNSYSMNVELSYDLNNIVCETDGNNNGVSKSGVNKSSVNKSSTTGMSDEEDESDKSSNKLDDTKQKLNQYKESAYNFANNNTAEIAAGLTTTGLATVGALLFAGLLGGKQNTKRTNKHTKKHTKKHTNKRLSKLV